MKTKSRQWLAIVLAFAMIFGIFGGFPVSVQAGTVSGGATRAKATAIKCNKEYTVHLSGTKAAYFKFTTPAGDYSRLNTYLSVSKNGYKGKYYAFFGSAERVDAANHKQWDSTTYKGEFPLLFCAPGTTYYLWICGGDAGCEGDLTFTMRASEDDSNDPKEFQPTPLTLSKTCRGVIDTKVGETEDKDWFSISTGDSSVFSITVRIDETKEEKDYVAPWVEVLIFTPSLNEIGNFNVMAGATETLKIELEKNKKYLLCLQDYDVNEKNKDWDDDLEDDYWNGWSDDEEEDDEEFNIYGTYSVLVKALTQKPWEIEVGAPKTVGISKKFHGSLWTGRYNKKAEVKWYSFTTGKAGNYCVVTAREENDLPEDEYESTLQVSLYNSNGKKLGSYDLEKKPMTKKGVYKLTANTKYLLKYTLTDFSTISELHDAYLEGIYTSRIELTQDFSAATISYTKKWTYAGKAVKPAVKVIHEGKTLKKGTDYTVSYANNKKCGKGKITITGMGNYTGSKTVYFAIYPQKQVISSLKSTKAGKATVKIQDDSSVAGYQICYALKSDFKKSKTVVSAGTSKTLSLSSGKTYYVRIRGIAKYGSKEIYGAWSDVKSVKVK